MAERHDDSLEAAIAELRRLASHSPEEQARLATMLRRMIDYAYLARSEEQSIVHSVRQILLARRQRASLFGADLFADPAWEMLLELYLAAREDRPLSVSALCHASGSPPSTGLRYIAALEAHDLVTRRPDPKDSRRTLIDPRPAAIEAVEVITGRFAARPLRNAPV